ncbi:unnamed protein product [Didymodactylos carnosus]|uniref:Uncharacterized protein n=1 Tax=Didymodactylos carnosus TaxID=1234261 RepID=A0A816EC47_9BILA|nr:unnamed protein product [Didymodactylos carnosus]CAF1648404.1 unnamed protein product [Didymodactylos carnosus]CAF3832194.1 unnamed protein product [Didymodactylos carnosus]CAF4571890.1 unnamed protein product [Didymodactylos carnosus]
MSLPSSLSLSGAAAAADTKEIVVVLPSDSEPLKRDSMEEGEEKFLREFENRVLDLIREFTQQFPYKQSIIWSIEYGENKEYCIHVMSPKHRK